MLLIKKDPMLPVSVLAAVISLFITPPSEELISAIDWHTLGILFMMLTVLEGFKKEQIFWPVLRLAGQIRTLTLLSAFLIFGVFFSSMFVTNDVSLIIFVPLTIILFRAGKKEHYILPVISMENIAAVRGSLLTPFGSPQNLFIFGQSGVSAGRFIRYMFPIWILSAGLLIIFILVLYRKDLSENTGIGEVEAAAAPDPAGRNRRRLYLALFAMIIWTIVSRTGLWPAAVVIVAVSVFFADRELMRRTDYVLLLTFLCFFIFSSSITANEGISSFLKKTVTGHEYWWTIGLSQIISNVPASIVLYPFTENFGGLIYGADTAGLCSIIGSLASVINYRIYVREYPGHGKKFLKTFTLISWAFFIIVVIPGWLLTRWSF